MELQRRGFFGAVCGVIAALLGWKPKPDCMPTMTVRDPRTGKTEICGLGWHGGARKFTAADREYFPYSIHADLEPGTNG